MMPLTIIRKKNLSQYKPVHKMASVDQMQYCKDSEKIGTSSINGSGNLITAFHSPVSNYVNFLRLHNEDMA